MEGGFPLADFFHRIYALDPNKTMSVRDRVLLGWDSNCLRRTPRAGIEETQWTDFTTLMQGVLLHYAPDRFGWTIEGSDSYTVSSLRTFLDNHMLHTGGPETR